MCNEVLLSYTNEWNGAICSNMDDLDNIILSQRQIYFTYMWNLKNNTNESIYKTETDSQT